LAEVLADLFRVNVADSRNVAAFVFAVFSHKGRASFRLMTKNGRGKLSGSIRSFRNGFKLVTA
jgi:hypothetical protein